MADLLLDALRPLPVTALGPLLAAMREPAGDAVSARAAVLVAAGMPTSATLRDVENVESKLRAAFPSWFVSLPSRTAVATADTALADALHPLPVAKLVPVLDALRAHPDNTATARSFLLQTGVLEDSITFAALGNVNFKLRNAFPQWFSPSADVLGLRRRLAVGSSTLLTLCKHLAATFRDSHLSAHVCDWQGSRGLGDVALRRLRSPLCRLLVVAPRRRGRCATGVNSWVGTAVDTLSASYIDSCDGR